MRMVMKFGGTSLADRERTLAAAQKVVSAAAQGNTVAVVVSAQGDLTEELINKARRMNARLPARELDALLSAGEQMSAALMAMAIQSLGADARSFTGWQAGIHTDGTHGDARIRCVDTQPLERALEQGKIAVTAGFQGVDENGDITTLGRGGSDTTAVALAAALHADCCRIYTDVAGVYDRDPRVYPDAVLLPRIGYAEMLAMARSGARVLHDRCVELAEEKGVVLEVRSSFTDAPGTLVGPIQSL